MTCGGNHLGFRIGIKNPNFLEVLQMIIHGQFGFESGFRENLNCASIIGRSFTNFMFFMLIGIPR
jgi:hypothetical protein